MGYVIDIFLDRIRSHVPAGARILDVACGPGYVALELARNGYDVLGIDIADAAIRSARETAATNPYQEGFGRLRYEVVSFSQEEADRFDGPFDVVLFSGALHHFKSLDQALALASSLLTKDGIIIASEPQHGRWTEQDAAQVALMRSLLTLAGCWYQEEAASNEVELDALVKAIHREYLLERDPGEPEGQSPNDLSHDGPEILQALQRRFKQLSITETVSFTYRLLGGLRGPDEKIFRIADFLAAYDRYCVSRGFMNANAFVFVGRNP
jgi:2-polyprenyl-6-hydroxyphenyl methylase/3-demethylubiquinone-9 3-methyltransferase